MHAPPFQPGLAPKREETRDQFGVGSGQGGCFNEASRRSARKLRDDGVLLSLTYLLQ